MRSIRRSLTLYFLVLLGLGLGAVGVFVDQLMERTLHTRELAEGKAIDLRVEDENRKERERFNGDLQNKAELLGREILVRYEAEPRRFQIGRLIVPGIGLGAGGGLPPAIWLAGTTPSRRQWFGPIGGPIAREHFTDLQSSEHFVRPIDEDDRHPEFIQINGASGNAWRSRGLLPVEIPIKPEQWDPSSQVEEKNGSLTLPDGREALMAVRKISLARMGGPRPRLEAGRTAAPGTRADPTPERDIFPFVFIHYARPVSELDERLAPIKARSAWQKDELVDQTARDRNDLRRWISGIGGATFLGIVLGVPLLIRRGLTPVRHLSDAVSRVSEKDFRLPVEREALSHELLPIHARLTDTLDELKRAFEREKQAVADISHELRTPVAGLLATLDVVLRKPRSAEQYRSALEDCRGIGRQLAGLVERVMTLATLDAGAEQTKLIDADAAEVAGRCAGVIRPLAAANGLAFTADLPGPVYANTDPDKLREVITNLLHNAVEYNRPGGSIRLSVHAAPSGGVEVEIADTGIGMTPDVREHIFERFYRADASRHAAGAHAGLGLSIVKEYLDRLGGTIAVDSESGVGSTFRVTLPAATHAEGEPAPEEAMVS